MYRLRGLDFLKMAEHFRPSPLLHLKPKPKRQTNEPAPFAVVTRECSCRRPNPSQRGNDNTELCRQPRHAPCIAVVNIHIHANYASCRGSIDKRIPHLIVSMLNECELWNATTGYDGDVWCCCLFWLTTTEKMLNFVPCATQTSLMSFQMMSRHCRGILMLW